MSEITANNFGIVIAYLVPGFTALAAISAHSPMIQTWLGGAPAGLPTVGGFLYITIASLGTGMTLSAIRWLVLDSLLHGMGMRRPSQDFSRLQLNLAAFEGAVQNHFRYYEFFGHMLLVLLLVVLDPAALVQILQTSPEAARGIAVVLVVVFFLASRDALAKYYARTALILGTRIAPQEVNHDERLALSRKPGPQQADQKKKT